MLERNCPAPPLPSTPARSIDWFDGVQAGGLFASAEDYDATGILPGVDPCESRYWWIPDLFTAAAVSAGQTPAGGPPLAGEWAVGERPEAVIERLRRSDQATRRNGSRTTAAA